MAAPTTERSGPRIGLVLAGGGARGAFEAGGPSDANLDTLDAARRECYGNERAADICSQTGLCLLRSYWRVAIPDEGER